MLYQIQTYFLTSQLPKLRETDTSRMLMFINATRNYIVSLFPTNTDRVICRKKSSSGKRAMHKLCKQCRSNGIRTSATGPTAHMRLLTFLIKTLNVESFYGRLFLWTFERSPIVSRPSHQHLGSPHTRVRDTRTSRVNQQIQI